MSPPQLVKKSIRRVLPVAVVIVLASLPCSAPLPPWQVYAFHDGSFQRLASSSFRHVVTSSRCHLVTPSPCPFVRPTWRVTASALADVTGDDLPEWVLVVWRPWRDWPIQQWSPAPSPIANFHDAAGNSCHLILLDPRDGRQVWAGSALPAPLMALAVGDVDGDAHNEVVTLEGDYARDGPATHVGVWRWNGFGFTAEWHSPPGASYGISQLCLTDTDSDSILDIVVR